MESVIDGTGFFATGVLLGAMLFFSGVLAPLIFTKLEAEVAGRFIRQVFPWSYLTVVALGSLAALAVAFFRPADAIALACVALAGVIARQGLMPSINRARDAVLAGEFAAKKQFSRLHRLSVWINALQIITVGFVLARLIPSPLELGGWPWQPFFPTARRRQAGNASISPSRFIRRPHRRCAYRKCCQPSSVHSTPR